MQRSILGARLIVALTLFTLVALTMPSVATAGPGDPIHNAPDFVIVVVEDGEQPTILFEGNSNAPPPIVVIVDQDGNVIRIIDLGSTRGCG